MTELVWAGLAGTGPIVEARLDGAGAGKVSAEPSQKKRKYQRYTAENHITLETNLCLAGSGHDLNICFHLLQDGLKSLTMKSGETTI